MNSYVLEALTELKSNTAVMAMLQNEVIGIRCETYEDIEDPNPSNIMACEVFGDIDEAIKYLRTAKSEAAVFIDGQGTINVLDL